MKRTCSNCNAEKAAADFPKKGAQCKACLAKKAAAKYHEKHAGAKPRGKRRAAKASAPAINGSGEILDGLRAHREKLQRSIDIVDQAIALLEADA